MCVQPSILLLYHTYTNLALHELGVGIVADGYKGGATHDDRLLLRLAVLDLHVSTVTSVKL
jgi:hypothetical protein